MSLLVEVHDMKHKPEYSSNPKPWGGYAPSPPMDTWYPGEYKPYM
jgi:hypothetical protein